MDKAHADRSLPSWPSSSKIAGKPYFRPLELNLHLGYRKGRHGGKWISRRYVGDRKYLVETIGAADDFADADGLETLTFYQAQAEARERARAAAEEARIARLGPVITVRSAIEDYLRAPEAGRALPADQARPRRRRS